MNKLNKQDFLSDCIKLALDNGWTAWGYAKPGYLIVCHKRSDYSKECILAPCADDDPLVLISTSLPELNVLHIVSFKEILFSHPFILALVGYEKIGNHTLHEEVLAKMAIDQDPLQCLYEFMEDSGKHIKPIPDES